MPSHDELVTLAETLTDYLRQLVEAGMPEEQQTPLLMAMQQQLVWHDMLGHICDPPDWEGE